MLQAARDRDTALEGRRILVVEDDVRNIFALSSVLEPKGAEASRSRATAARRSTCSPEAGTREGGAIDLVLMDIMMPEMDGLTAMREIRKQPTGEAADHRAHRQGDEGRSGEVPRGRRQRLHRQAARRREAALAGARLDAEVRRRARPANRHRAAAAARGHLPEVSLRFPELRDRLAEAAAARGDGAVRVRDAVGAPGAGAARPGDVSGRCSTS